VKKKENEDSHLPTIIIADSAVQIFIKLPNLLQVNVDFLPKKKTVVLVHLSTTAICILVSTYQNERIVTNCTGEHMYHDDQSW